MAQAGTPDHRDAERRMRELVREAGLPQPDEVRDRFDPDEIVLMWHERKLAVVIELDEPAEDAVELLGEGPRPEWATG
jgi:hypothetical protein